MGSVAREIAAQKLHKMHEGMKAVMVALTYSPLQVSILVALAIHTTDIGTLYYTHSGTTTKLLCTRAL